MTNSLRLRVWDSQSNVWRGRGGPGSIALEDPIDPGEPWVPPAARTAGATSLGSTNYAIPTDGRPVYYVDSASGDDSNAGSLGSPKKTVGATVNAYKSQGSSSQPVTIILREGLYEEGDIQPGNGYYITLQAYPYETVWFDGSLAFSGSWTNNGNGTWTRAYTAPAIPSVGVDILDGYAQAHYPDMIFVNGTELWQIADNATPAAGQFSVNRSGNTVTIAENPSGKSIRYANESRLLFSGSQVNFYGIGVRRYSGASSTSSYTTLYFGGTSAGTVIENCLFTQIGRSVLSFTKVDCRVTKCTITDVNQRGIGANTANNLIIEECLIEKVNRGLWKMQPQTGAIKITAARNTIVRHCILRDAASGALLWWDVSCTQCYVYDCLLDGQSSVNGLLVETGIVYEECDGGYWDSTQYMSQIIGNTVINCHKPIAVVAAGHVYIANNTLSAKWTASNTSQGILILQDRDDNHGQQVPVANCHWWVAGVELINNRIKTQTNGWQLLAYDSQNEVPRPRAQAQGLGSATGQQVGGAMLSRVQGNWFAAANGSTSAGSVMATIGKADGVRINVNTPSALATPNATYGLSSTNIKANYQSATEPTSASDHATALALPSELASTIGVANGFQYIGNPLNNPVAVG